MGLSKEDWDELDEDDGSIFVFLHDRILTLTGVCCRWSGSWSWSVVRWREVNAQHRPMNGERRIGGYKIIIAGGKAKGKQDQGERRVWNCRRRAIQSSLQFPVSSLTGGAVSTSISGSPCTSVTGRNWLTATGIPDY